MMMDADMGIARNKFQEGSLWFLGLCIEFGLIFLEFLAFITLHHSFGGPPKYAPRCLFWTSSNKFTITGTSVFFHDFLRIGNCTSSSLLLALPLLQCCCKHPGYELGFGDVDVIQLALSQQPRHSVYLAWRPPAELATLDMAAVAITFRHFCE